MKLRKLLTCAAYPAIVGLFPTLYAQNSSSQPKAAPATGQPQETSSSPFVLRQYSRMVNVDVVVKDGKGNHIRGLKAEDFQIYEQTPSASRRKRQQKIFRINEIETAGMNPPAAAPVQTAPGVYTNAVAVQKDPVPPTVLLVDGLNTEIQHQAQVHAQMTRMLKRICRGAWYAMGLPKFGLISAASNGLLSSV